MLRLAHFLCLHGKAFAERKGSRRLSRTITGAIGISPPPLNQNPKMAPAMAMSCPVLSAFCLIGQNASFKAVCKIP